LPLAFNLSSLDYVWTESINIQADGSIRPPTAPISSVDNVTYTLTDNITGNVTDYSSAIIIQKDNIIVDGAGYTLRGTTASNSKGIDLTGRSNVTIENMNITAFYVGIVLLSSSNNSVSGNNITANNEDGIVLDSSSNNTIYHNSFINNTGQVYSVGSTIVWDDGYPSGGNYWSNYNGTDSCSGPYQNETGFDWIGDSPYVIDQNNTDRYPLMTHFSSDIEETRIAYRNLLLRFTETSFEIEALNSTLAGLVERITGMQSQLDYLNETVFYLQQQIVALNTTVTSTRSELHAQIESLNSQVLGLQGRLDSLNSTLQSSTNTQQDHYNSLSNQMNGALNMTYAFAATSAILVIAVVYLILRKPRTKPDA
jgi:parallel beta-helix repeat protein